MDSRRYFLQLLMISLVAADAVLDQTDEFILQELMEVMSIPKRSEAFKYLSYEKPLQAKEFVDSCDATNKNHGYGCDETDGPVKTEARLTQYATVNAMQAKVSWNSCKNNSPIQIDYLNISPDTLSIPGVVNIEGSVTTTEDLTQGLKVKIKLWRKVLLAWIKIPCVGGVGSCTYDDICSLIPSQCPSTVTDFGLPCGCPVPKGTYTIPKTAFDLPSIDLPSWIASGDFEAEITVYDKEGSILGCITVKLSIK